MENLKPQTMVHVLELLRTALPGMKIVTRTADKSEFDQLTTSWSRPHGEVHLPCAVLRPKSTEEIGKVVKLLKPLHCSLAVRSGGHDFWDRSVGPAVDALILDIRDIDQVKVDEKNIAEIGGGANHYQVIKGLEKSGHLAVTGGCPSVGYVGWACCGGYGLQSCLLGLGVDQIVGATVVNADGDIIEADDNLLWGIRGAGTALGIITRLKIKTYPSQPVFTTHIVPVASYLLQYRFWPDQLLLALSSRSKCWSNIFSFRFPPNVGPICAGYHLPRLAR